MKNLIFFFLAFLGILQIKAQCIVDAGPDVTLCFQQALWPDGETFIPKGHGYLGGNPTVIKGTPPFTFHWYTPDPDENQYLFTNRDTSNPRIYFGNFGTGRGANIIVRLEDALANICFDTLYFRETWLSVALGNIADNIERGDTTHVYLFTEDMPAQDIVSYNWWPVHSILDPSEARPKVFPDTSTAYYCDIVDKFGCEYTTVWPFKVNVFPVGIANVASDENKAFFNAKSAQIVFKQSDEKRLQFYSLDGKLVKEASTSATTFSVNDLPNGSYILHWTNKKLEKGSLKFVKH